jgi:membrane protease YdiL (CAAX protease family)
MSSQDGGDPHTPEDPPPSPDSDRPSGEPPSGGDRPMSALLATGWALGTTFFFYALILVLVSVRPGAADDVVSIFACQAIAYLLGLFLILRVHAPEVGIRDFVGARPTSPLFYPLAVVLGVALEIPANALYNAIEKRWPSETEDTLGKLFLGAEAPKKALIVLVVVALGPMLEEIFFRGALFRPMRRVHPGWTVVLVSAVLFALAHFQLQMYLPIALVGLVLGVTRLASGSILPSMLAHATFNAVPFVAMLVQGQGATDADVPLPPWLVAASSALTLLLLGALHLLGARAPSALHAQEADLR